MFTQNVTPKDASGRTDTEQRPATMDTVFNLLSSERRRLAMTLLRDRGPLEKGELADHIAAIQHDTTPDGIHSQQRKRVYVSLHQAHLPKLEDGQAVVIGDDGEIALGPAADQLLEHIKPRNERLDHLAVRPPDRGIGRQ